eukprot:5173746-Amphidinium_carterae.1
MLLAYTPQHGTTQCVRCFGVKVCVIHRSFDVLARLSSCCTTVTVSTFDDGILFGVATPLHFFVFGSALDFLVFATSGLATSCEPLRRSGSP